MSVHSAFDGGSEDKAVIFFLLCLAEVDFLLSPSKPVSLGSHSYWVRESRYSGDFLICLLAFPGF